MENDVSDISSVVECVFVAAVTSFTEPLHSNDKEYTYRHTQTDVRDLRMMQFEMGSVAMIYISVT
jgi:hypothetical protein